MKNVRLILAGIFVFSNLFADESDPTQLCDAKYETCLAQCDMQENVEAECYTLCDTTYQKCLEQVYAAPSVEAEQNKPEVSAEENNQSE